MESKPKKILYLPPHSDACGWYRCAVPGRGLQKRGWHVNSSQWVKGDFLKQYDVVIFQRSSSDRMCKWIKFCNSVGILTVGEIDDNLWTIHEQNPANAFWTQQKLKGLEECLRAVQLITTTTPALAEYLKPINSNIAILPNMLPAKHWQVRQTESSGGKIIIGWAGSTSHLPDLGLLKSVIPQILDEYPKTEFHIAGLNKSPFLEHKRIKAVDPVRGEDFALLLATFNIGVMPLLDTRFNSCKSDLKFIEYTMVGLPVVASKVDAYKHTIVHGKNGFLAKNTKD